MTWKLFQAVERLLCTCEALNSNPGSAKEKKLAGYNSHYTNNIKVLYENYLVKF
jgi:hypothetical protein